VNNSVTGTTFGHIVQARDMRGAVAFHQHVHEQRPVEFPLRFGRVPPRADGFVGREIAPTSRGPRAGSARRSSPSTPPRLNTDVLLGLGGVGKTQLAVDHVEGARAAGALDLLVWVTATSREAVVADFARIAAQLAGEQDIASEVGAMLSERTQHVRAFAENLLGALARESEVVCQAG
jgi:hypothetical protein